MATQAGGTILLAGNPSGGGTGRTVALLGLVGVGGYGAHLMAQEGQLPETLQRFLHELVPQTYPLAPRLTGTSTTAGPKPPPGTKPRGPLPNPLPQPPPQPQPPVTWPDGGYHGPAHPREFREIVDLEPYGARGFVWNPLSANGEVAWLETGEWIAEYANSPEEAASWAIAWWQTRTDTRPYGPIDLADYGAGGFLWDHGVVWVINGGNAFPIGNAAGPEQAAGVAAAWYAAQAA